MRIVNIMGRPIFLNNRQEAAINFAEKMSARWEEQKREEKRKEEESILQNALRRMEERSRRYSMVERMKREMLLKNAPKHHAWEYDEFEFFHEGVMYLYSRGEIINPQEIEELEII